MTKAERIFNDTRFDCLKHLKDWGYQQNDNGTAVGFNRMTYGENESMCQRTVNDIRKILESKRRGIAIDRKLGVSTPEKLDFEERVLNMVESTLNSQERSINSWKSW